MIFDYIKLFLTLAILFIPLGYFALEHFLGKKDKLNIIEKFVLSFNLGWIISNFLVIFLNAINLKLTLTLNLSSHLILALLLFIGLKLRKIKLIEKLKKENLRLDNVKLITFSLLLFLSFFINARFLVQDIVPNNTDLGHHMYWPLLMLENNSLPEYDTSDVIIGEHIIFYLTSQISGVSPISSLPTIVLSLMNIFSFLGVFVLTLRITRSYYLALLSFIFIGVLYSVSDPMMKFASGGVVGNISGNVYMPNIMLLLFLSYKKKSSSFLSLAIIFFFGLLYTHHLSTFLLAFIILAFIVMQVVLNIIFKEKKKTTPFLPIKRWFKILIKPLTLTTITFFVIFFFFVYMPHYIENNAVETVVDKPQKDTRVGVSINSFIRSIGEFRSFLGILGIGVFIYTEKKYAFVKKISKKVLKKNRQTNLSISLLFGWVFIMSILSFYPAIFMVDLPSRRVVNYLVIPFAILSAIFIFHLAGLIKKKLNSKQAAAVTLTLAIAIALNGFADSLSYFRSTNQFTEAVNVFHASRFLKQNTPEDAVILKDHANLKADNWIKNFLLRGYNYILARTWDYKYEDNPDREQCTFLMATQPDSRKGRTCFDETETEYVILANGEYNYFFDLSDNFEKIYHNDTAVIYKKK